MRRHILTAVLGSAAVFALLLVPLSPAIGHPDSAPGEGKDAPHDGDTPEYLMEAHRNTPCVQGMAGPFPCENVHMHSFLPMSDIGGGRGSDVWGWQDPETDRRYAIAGRENGTAFVDVTNPTRPLFLADLPTSGTQDVIWRDMKVYADHAYIVSEAPEHGMQVVDLSILRELDRRQAPHTISETTLYTEFGRTHNLGMNFETGYAYAVGNREDQRGCNAGLHMIDLSDPADPQFAGCFGDDGYTHDTQCVIYEGADERYHDREICFNSNEDTLTIVDVTDKSDPEMISRTGYEQVGYTHQGWLTEDHEQFILNDELDELFFGNNTRTYVWDLEDLEAPEVIGIHEADTAATTHNDYVVGDRVYQANYRAGLQVLDLTNVADGELEEVASFDTYPPDDEAGFGHGSWSNYPFFDNGIVLVHGYEGLFVLRPTG